MATETVSLRCDGNSMASVLFDASAVITAVCHQLAEGEDAHGARRALTVANTMLQTAAEVLMDCGIDALNQEVAQRFARLCGEAAA